MQRRLSWDLFLISFLMIMKVTDVMQSYQTQTLLRKFFGRDVVIFCAFHSQHSLVFSGTIKTLISLRGRNVVDAAQNFVNLLTQQYQFPGLIYPWCPPRIGIVLDVLEALEAQLWAILYQGLRVEHQNSTHSRQSSESSSIDESELFTLEGKTKYVVSWAGVAIVGDTLPTRARESNDEDSHGGSSEESELGELG